MGDTLIYKLISDPSILRVMDGDILRSTVGTQPLVFDPEDWNAIDQTVEEYNQANRINLSLPDLSLYAIFIANGYSEAIARALSNT